MLKRHYLSHLDDEAPPKRQRVGQDFRQKVSKACSACAESKVRCEGGIPCQRCLTKKIPCQSRSRLTSQRPRFKSMSGSTLSTDSSHLTFANSNDFFSEQQVLKNSLHMPHEQITESALIPSVPLTDDCMVTDGSVRTDLRDTSIDLSLTPGTIDQRKFSPLSRFRMLNWSSTRLGHPYGNGLRL